MRLARVLLLFVCCAFVPGAAADLDWPQWRGPNRDGVSTETGLLKQWPPKGPSAVWSISNLGRGYGAPAILGDRIFVQGTRGGKSGVFCLNRATGAMLWFRALGQDLDQDKGGGPRGTPTVEGDRLYALSEDGDLACLRAADGSVSWTRNILKDFDGTNPQWLISESPLIDGDRVIITPGGRRAAIAALDKATGKTVWTTTELSDPAAYSSCIVANVQGVRTIMTLTSQAGVGVRANDGKLLWRFPRVANRTRQRHDARLLRQPRVLHLGLRHRQCAAATEGRERRASAPTRSISAAT